MGTDSATFETDQARDARIYKNTKRIRKHEKLGLLVMGYMIAEGSKIVTDLAQLL